MNTRGPSNTQDVGAAVQSVVMAFLAGRVHTAMPGKVIEYDPTTRTGTVQPMVRRAKLDGSQIEHKPIPDVPFAIYGTADAGVVLPVAAGDFVLLIFNEKKSDGFFTSGQMSDTSLNRLFDLSDAVALPGLFPSGASIPSGNAGDIAIYNNGGNVSINSASGSQVKINGTNLTVDA